ncbi:MAG: GTP-binding protein [Acidimicrobiia bacterium]
MDQQVGLTALFGAGGRATEDALRLLARNTGGVTAVVPQQAPVPAGLPWVRTVEAVAERSLGCPCCAVRLDLHRALGRLLGHRRPPAGIVVVGTAVTDPGPVLATLLCDPLLARRTRLDATVWALDGPEAAVRVATGDGLAATGEEAEQLALADAVLLTGMGRLTPSARLAVERAVRAANPVATVVIGDEGDVPASWPQGTDAYSLEAVAARLDGLAGPDAGGDGVLLVDLEGHADVAGIQAWLQQLVRSHAADLLRLQVVCSLPGRSERWACSAVRSFCTTGMVGPPPDGRSRIRMLAVARNLSVGQLTASLRHAFDGRP